MQQPEAPLEADGVPESPEIVDQAPEMARKTSLVEVEEVEATAYAKTSEKLLE